MASRKHERVQKNLRTQLAVAVRSIQWSYGILWSYSTTKEGVLEWNEGYYNGDIKTRKTVQTAELKADKIGLQRSEQLRELYKFLLSGEADSQAKRPSAALSPEDLTDLEWYYLVCMSFVFNPNESLPGRVLESGETIWLCNAQSADSKVFSRSLLAKSASIQTVVCFPYLEGVIEIGTTELVSEDLNIIQHVKACFLDFSKPLCHNKSSYTLKKADDDDKDPTCTKAENETSGAIALDNLCSSPEEIKFDEDPMNELQEDNDQEFNMDSPDQCSNSFEQHGHTDGTMLIRVHGGDSQVNCSRLMDDALSNGAGDSLSSGDCISDAFENQGETYKNAGQMHLRDFQDCNQSKLGFLNIGADEDLHYTRALSALLGSSSMFRQNPYASNSSCKSCFVRWKKGGVSGRPRPRVNQSMLKKILFTVPLMYSSCSSPKSQKENDKIKWKSQFRSHDNFMGNVLLDKRGELEKFEVLKDIVPSINEVDNISILSDTIKYLKELEARVEELESCMDLADSEARTPRKFPDTLEQISDNYDAGKTWKVKKSRINKRKACDIDEEDTELKRMIPKVGVPLDVKVNMQEEEVLIEIKCPYREYILLDIMDAIHKLHLDAHTVQSLTVDGVLMMTLASKFRGSAIAPLGMIKETLWKVSGTV